MAAPTGVVQFFDSLNGATPSPIGPPQAINRGNGSTLLATIAPVLGPGNHIITAAYLGDTNWNTANARPIEVVVIAEHH